MAMKNASLIRLVLCVVCAGGLFETVALFHTDAFLLQDKNSLTIQVNRLFPARSVVTEYTIPVSAPVPVWGAAVNAHVRLSSPAGMVRIIITDTAGHDYLIYETWSLLQETDTVTLQNACMETRALQAIKPVRVTVQVIDASAAVASIILGTTEGGPPEECGRHGETIRREQHRLIIACLNRQISKNGLSWKAGPTDLPQKTYEEKKCVFGSQDAVLPNLQGLEYYTGGIFELRSGKKGSSAPVKRENGSVVIDAFDWRAKHGATNPQSPYYDNDKYCSGWATQIRNQSLPQYCGSCWSHSTVATAEMMTNLYYNRHIDLNLSEQYLMTCSCAEACFTNGKPCSGGRSTKAAEWIVNHGVTDEENFPYQAVDSLTCSDSGANPVEHLQFANGIYTDTVPSEDSLKQFLIHYGPLNVFVFSMWHCMCLVGYAWDTTAGQTTWILKNSFGVMSGNNGYMYARLDMSDLKTVDAFIPPVISKVYTDKDIRCVDFDQDGYYNWGIGPKPATCPQGCSDEEDCDDSRSDLGPVLADGSCKQIISPIDDFSGANPLVRWSVMKNGPHGSVLIRFSTALGAAVKMAIYTCHGTTIAVLPVDTRDKEMQQCIWNGESLTGSKVADGVYVCRVAYNANGVFRYCTFKILLP